MVDVILSADNLTVLGGPEEIEVDFNIGAEGERGSVWFTGLTNPNSLNTQTDFPLVPKLLDFFINVDPSDEDYLQIYQYVLSDGGTTWSKSFNLNTSAYYSNEVVSFENGLGQINVDITSLGLINALVESLDNSFAYFNVQASASNVNVEDAPEGANLNHLPIAMSFSVGNAFFDSEGLTEASEFPFKLPISLTAVEYDNSLWSPIDQKSIIVHFAISYANPTEIIANLGGGVS